MTRLLWDALGDVPDRRGRQGRQYELRSVLGIALAAMLAGANVVLFDGAVVNRDARVVDGVVNHSERIGLRRPAEIVDRPRPVSLPRCINLEDGDDLAGLRLRN